jgi:hypothetical protein
MNELFHGNGGVAGAYRNILLLLPQALVHPLKRGYEKPFLGLKVIVQHILADVAALRNTVNPRAFKPDPCKFLRRQFQYLLANTRRISTSRRHDGLLCFEPNNQNTGDAAVPPLSA